MLGAFIQEAEHIYIACGATDFRKQINGLAALVQMKYRLDPYSESCVFIFCNRKHNAIKVLRFDENGFVLATKKLINKMKFQWPGKTDEIKDITFQQVRWLLEGLEIEQKKALKSIKRKENNTCF
jgi:transposase